MSQGPCFMINFFELGYYPPVEPRSMKCFHKGLTLKQQEMSSVLLFRHAQTKFFNNFAYITCESIIKQVDLTKIV